jgi:hypothetical protein
VFLVTIQARLAITAECILSRHLEAGPVGATPKRHDAARPASARSAS